MKTAVLVLAALAVTGCMGRSTASSSRPVSTSTTALTISISAEDQERLTKVWTLTCPDQGTLPRPERACQRLAALNKPFAPVPKSAACTEVYGGPLVADVSGRLRGRRVAAHFSRTNGCEIARWNRVRFLFPDT
ncbi:MAG: SSI family serine proteinase inhibitor [Actinomycetota bacterium]